MKDALAQDVCLKCDAPKRPGVKFCGNCGTPHDTHFCSDCGEANAPTAKFCRACASSFTRSAPVPDIAFRAPELAATVTHLPSSQFEDVAPQLSPEQAPAFHSFRNENPDSSTSDGIGARLFEAFQLQTKITVGAALALFILLAGAAWALFWREPGVAVGAGAVGAASSRSYVYYATRPAFIRDAATSRGSHVLGRLNRGDAITGSPSPGIDSLQQWLKITAGPYQKNFVSTVNLATAPPPAITRVVNASRSLGQTGDLRTAPQEDSAIIDTLATGSTVVVAGEVGTWAEILRKVGGVGYLPLAALRQSGGVAPLPSVAVQQAPVFTTPPIAPKTETFTCIAINKKVNAATIIVNYENFTVVSPNFGSVNQVMPAQISPSTIAWHARQIRNWGFGGYNEQDMSLDRTTGQLTDRYSGGITMFTCNSTRP